MVSVTGTLIWYYYICRREVWLMAHAIEPLQDNPFIEIGKIISERSFKREKKEIRFENIVLDLIKRDGSQIVVGEIKKSSRFIESARMQLAFYLTKLKEKGIEIEGELLFPKEKKREKVVLTSELEQRLKKVCNEIEELVQFDLPPKPIKIGYCKSCGYREMCWA